MALDEKERAIFRLILEKMKVQILKRKNSAYRTVVESTKHLREQVNDEGERSEVNSRLAVSIGLNETFGQVLQKIEDAFERINRGVFGDCAGCDWPIPLARLVVVPYEGLCVECKSSEELVSGAAISGLAGKFEFEE